ncbi:hypothetical protein [Gorillibacterium sp. sgz500922]|uniref:hypothetical protein n=1 Tax=Gorillibacterium sp. sgz500922 TaxID=3446694 RepID=UPI003F6681C6
MTREQVLERQSEMLKRNMQELIMKQNQRGLSRQDGRYLQQVIKQFHQNVHSLHDSAK